jgi:REP-associated tyrosine transposase
MRIHGFVTWERIINQRLAPNCRLSTEWLLAGFGRRKSKAIDAYKRFVSEGKNQPSLWEQLRNQVFLGDEQFVTSMQGLIDGDKELSEIPVSHRRALPKELSYYANKYKTRNEAIVSAYASGGYSLKDVEDYFELHYSTVSGIIKNHKSKI